MEKRFCPMTEIRAYKDEDKNRITGYAAVFNSWSEDLGGFRERIKPGAFDRACNEDDVRALYNHNPDHVLGRTSSNTLTLREDEKGLYMEIDVPDTQTGRDLLTSVERGDITGASFSFDVRDDEFYEDEEGTKRELRDLKLHDVGPVTFPAYEATEVSKRALDKAKEKEEKKFNKLTILKRKTEIAELEV